MSTELGKSYMGATFGDKRLPERFWKKVRIEGGCWIWTATRSDRYGRFRINNAYRLVHRASYETFIGEIPKNLAIDHLCRVTKCVNPAHLEAVTHRENTLRISNFMATRITSQHCKNGHPLSGDNLDPWHLARGVRRCSECLRGWTRNKHRQRRRAAGIPHHPEREGAYGRRRKTAAN